MAFDRGDWREKWKLSNPEKVKAQLARDAAARRVTRKTESPEAREIRLSKHRERHKRWRDANPEKLKEYVKADRAKNMDRIRRQARTLALWKQYGVTTEAYDAALEAQGHRCAICRTDKAAARHSHYSWRVDHCHATDKVRGLLCHNCNIAMGLLKENMETLEAMINYLKYHKIT